MSTIRCDGCGEYREWDGYTLVKGCSCLGKIGEPTVYDELELLKSDLRKLVEEMKVDVTRWGDDDNIPDTMEEAWDEGSLSVVDKIEKLLEGE